MGSLDGVYSTRSIWAGPREVVHVTYDPKEIDYQTLLSNAAKMECTSAVYTHDDEQHDVATAAGIENVIAWKESLATRQVQKSEQKYYLRNTLLAYLPLTELQAVKMNAALTENSDAEVTSFLSPRQKKLLKRIQAVVEADKDALAGLGFPEDQNDLIDYQRKLLDRLQALESSR